MTKFTFAVAGVALLALPTLFACSGGQVLSIGSDLKSGAGTDGGDSDGGAGASDGGTPCTTNAQCGTSEACGFAPGAACGSLGACFSTIGIAECNSFEPGCSCDGQEINLACNPLPVGYTTAPVAHAGACSTSTDGGSGAQDAGGPCTVDADCGSNGVCGFLEADACTATGICFTKSGVNCNAVEPGCACDGTEINLACNNLPPNYSPAPLLHTGACP